MNIQLAQLVYQALNFLIVFGALSYLLYKPILKIFAERSKRIEEGQKAAQKALAEQEKFEETKQKAKAKIEKERESILKEATDTAKEQAAQIVVDAKTQAESEIAQLKEQWKDQQRKEKAEMESQLVELVIATTSKVLGSELTIKDHRALIKKELQVIAAQ
ncbi:MAG: ATP synthase F0 subunit B [bacterium]|nr:ATP synthase F0 subunit B [bacterium]